MEYYIIGVLCFINEIKGHVRMSGNYKYLAKNIGVLTISNFATNLLSFFLVPLYTYILSTEEYGSYDLINTTIALMVPILTLNIMDGVLRYAISEDVDNTHVFTVGMRYFLISMLPVLLLVGINKWLYIVPVIADYALYIIAMYVVTALQGIIVSMTRGIDKVVAVSVASVLGSVTMISGNLLFLLVFKWGLVGYFLANILGLLVQCVYMFFAAKLYKYIVNPFRAAKDYDSMRKQMVRYSAPLIANNVAWWVNSVSDRYIVTGICGVAQNGIYSIGYKIPSVLSIFQNIFNQAWILSAVKDYDADDKDGFFSNLYKLYNCAMVLLCACIVAGDRILAVFLYQKEFYDAWKYVPFLTIAIVFGAMSGYIGGIFTAVERSDIFAKSTVVGAVVNTILNFVLVYSMGPIGAAIATAVAYFIVWIIRYYHVKQYMHLKINIIRDLISYGVLLAQTLVLLFMPENVVMYAAQTALVLFLLLLYRRDIFGLIAYVTKRGKK